MADIQVLSGLNAKTAPVPLFIAETWPNFSNQLLTAAFVGSGWPMSPDYDYSLRRRSLATPRGQHTVTGNLTASAGYATPTAANHLTTPVTDSAALSSGSSKITLCAVMRTPRVAQGEIWSTLFSSAESSIRFYVGSSGTIVAAADNAAEASSTVSLSTTGMTAGAWEFVAAVFNGLNVTLYRRAADNADFVTGTGTLSISALAGANRAFRFGCTQQSAPTNVGGCDLATGAIYKGALTAAQIEAARVKLQPRLAAKGIAI